MGAGNAAGFQAGMDTAGAATAAGSYGADASAAATYGPQTGYGDVTGQAAAGYGDASQGAAAAAYAAQASQGIPLCHLDILQRVVLRHYTQHSIITLRRLGRL